MAISENISPKLNRRPSTRLTPCQASVPPPTDVGRPPVLLRRYVPLSARWLTCILLSTRRSYRTPATKAATPRSAPTSTRDAREITSDSPMHHRDDNSG